MNKLVMPKQTAELDVFYASLRIYYEDDDNWVSNSDYKHRIQELVPRLTSSARDGAFLVKQSEMTRYFGLVEYDYAAREGRARITQTGRYFYEAHERGYREAERKIIMQAILCNNFGRNNTAVESSDSDLDPPKLFIKAIYDTTQTVQNEANDPGNGSLENETNYDHDGITRSDLAYLIYLTNDKGFSYEDAINLLIGYYTMPSDLPNKYTDVKFTKFLENLGIVQVDHGKYELSPEILQNYGKQIGDLSIYNRPMEPENVDLEQFTTARASAYSDIESDDFKRQNEREPLKIEVGTRVQYKKEPRISKTALVRAEHECAINSEHVTFAGKDGEPYMEAHHLIPMSAQGDFDVNIDRLENIVALCPTCHRAIHYGNKETREELVRKLYDLQQEDFAQAELDISYDDLFSKYYS